MTSHELVDRAITFRKPERLPFWQHVFPDVPDDVCDCWEMDRGKGGWFFDNPCVDDWQCGWEKTDKKNMGQVVHHPLQDWSKLASYRPPDPRDPYYFERLKDELAQAGDRYVVVTSHFNLFERVHMLHGFADTLTDLYEQPDRVEKLIDLVLEWKLAHFAELHRRFGDRVHGLFLTDDWGTQEAPIISGPMFETYFRDRYRLLVDAIHEHGWRLMLHSCGRVNDFVPYFVELGIDVLNMQQPRCYGIEELGRRFAGQIAFLTTTDIQATLPTNDRHAIEAEAELLIKHWSAPDGGFIVFNYGDPEALGIAPATARIMFDAFVRLMRR
ncbi:hypothetical protein HQ590_13140 [bacterium]|nr:hypothetical protein [bacterium]